MAVWNPTHWRPGWKWASLDTQPSMALFIKKEQVGHSGSIYLNMLEVSEHGITFEDMEDHAHIPRKHGMVRMPWTVSHHYFELLGKLL